MQHVDEVATGKGRGTVTAYQFDADESMVARKRDASVTRIEQVEPFMVGQRVRDKRCSPCCPGSDSVSSPRTRLLPGGGASARKERPWNRIQLSRPRSTSCCMASDGTTYAHTVNDAVGWSSRKNFTLKRSATEVWRGGDLPTPPKTLVECDVRRRQRKHPRVSCSPARGCL